MAGHVERNDGRMKKVRKLNPVCHGRFGPKKTWPEVIRLDCLAQGLAEIHLSYRKARSGTLKSVARLDPPLR